MTQNLIYFWFITLRIKLLYWKREIIVFLKDYQLNAFDVNQKIISMVIAFLNDSC